MKAKQYDKLSAEEKRVKVAELCGYTKVDTFMPKHNGMLQPYSVCGRHPLMSDPYDREELPDYLNDLNACHEFEAGLDDPTFCRYLDNVILVTLGTVQGIRILSATAEQRCKAFVLTMTGGE